MMRPFSFSVSSSSMTLGDVRWCKASVPLYMLSVPSVCLECLPLPSLSKLLLILQNKAHGSPSCTGQAVLSSRITWRAPPSYQSHQTSAPFNATDLFICASQRAPSFLEQGIDPICFCIPRLHLNRCSASICSRNQEFTVFINKCIR